MHEEESTPESEVEAPNGATEQPCTESEAEESQRCLPKNHCGRSSRKPLKPSTRFKLISRTSNAAVWKTKRATASGRMDVIRPLLGVLDQVDLALQDREAVSVEAIFSGVQLVRDEMCRVLDGQGVVMIPSPVRI